MIVVGGGAVGVSVAYELALAGCSVTLLERGERLAAGCSSGNGGVISPSHANPLANPATLRAALQSVARRGGTVSVRVRRDTVGWLARYALSCGAARAAKGRRALEAISRASLELHAALDAALGTSFERRGVLNVYETEAGLREVTPEDPALPTRILTPQALRELEPALGAGVAGATHHPEEAYVNPVNFVSAVGAGAREAGADLRTGVEVRSLRRRAGMVEVGTGAGELRAGTVVLAAGVWTAALARSLGIFVPLIAAKGHHVDFERGQGDPRIPLLLHEARLVASPFEDRLRVAGLVELTGIDPAVSVRQVAAIASAAVRVLPALAGRPVLETWAGLRPCTSDGLPVIGRPAAAPEVVIATGHAMKGVALAPVTARLVAELVSGGPPSHDLSPFRPGRFRPPARRP